jgi:hypothetical protein
LDGHGFVVDAEYLKSKARSQSEKKKPWPQSDQKRIGFRPATTDETSSAKVKLAATHQDNKNKPPLIQKQREKRETKRKNKDKYK